MEQRKIVLFIAASLDGYIATQEHSLDWLFAVEGEGDNGYAAFYETVDTIIMGRTTYDWVMDYEKGKFPYPGRECYVFSNTKTGIDANVRFTSGDIAPFVKALKAKPGKHIWLVGGGELIAAFLREHLVDEIILTIAPVLLGTGIPLFKAIPVQNMLQLTGIQRYGQFAELHYDVLQPNA